MPISTRLIVISPNLTQQLIVVIHKNSIENTDLVYSVDCDEHSLVDVRFYSVEDHDDSLERLLPDRAVPELCTIFIFP